MKLVNRSELLTRQKKKIDEVRAGYVPVATRASILFFAISDLGNVEPTYQYALNWFNNLFTRCILEAEPSDDLETRLKSLIDYFTYALYCNICRSLLEKDKLLFSFLLTVRILMAEEKINSDEWYFLLTGGLAADNPHPNPTDWLNAKSWDEICRLSDQAVFNGLREDFSDNADGFKAIYDSSDAHQVELPGKWNEVSAFQKLLLLRCLRSDKVTLGVQDYVIKEMGEAYVKPPPFNLAKCFEDSSPTVPLVFVLSAGSDPMTALIRFADQMEAQIDSISLGQGQGPKAEKMIERGLSAGTWVVLQNCHLAVSWLPTLEKITEDIIASDTPPHRDFRLYCTTYPDPGFPSSILQNSVKMTLEPPSGLRANVLNSYMNDPISNPDFFNSCEGNFKKLCYSLSFFHAIVQVRRGFGSLGFNNPYEFNNSDLEISLKQLPTFLDLYGHNSAWKALNYVTGQCNYGGRVTDDKDRRALMTILGQYYSPDVLQDGYKLSSSGVYTMPPDGDHNSYLEHIRKLPLVVKPEVFGLHENADITKDQNATLLLFQSILKTESGGGGGGGGEEEKS